VGLLWSFPDINGGAPEVQAVVSFGLNSSVCSRFLVSAGRFRLNSDILITSICREPLLDAGSFENESKTCGEGWGNGYESILVVVVVNTFVSGE